MQGLQARSHLVAFWVGAHEPSQTLEPVAHQLRLAQLLGHRRNPLVCRPERGFYLFQCPKLGFFALHRHLPTLAAEHSTPPRTPCARLSPFCSGMGLAPALLPLGRLVGYFSPPEGEQLPAQAVALPFGLFAPPTLLVHPLVQRGFRHLAAGPFGAELFLDLSQLVGRAGTHIRFSRRSKGLKFSA